MPRVTFWAWGEQKAMVTSCRRAWQRLTKAPPGKTPAALAEGYAHFQVLRPADYSEKLTRSMKPLDMTRFCDSMVYCTSRTWSRNPGGNNFVRRA
jgi:hypothetical protein